MENRPRLSQRILVVDDDLDSANFLARLIENCGHQVQVAYNGLDAVRVAHDFMPQIAFLDINMPGLDGYAVAHAIRRAPNLKSTKLVALSALSHEEHEQRCLEVGFDRQVVKPASLRFLLDLVDTLGATSDEAAEKVD